MMLPFSFQKGNKAAGCEDAPPVSNIKFSVVCDGLGGAGSTKHKVTPNKTPWDEIGLELDNTIRVDTDYTFYNELTIKTLKKWIARVIGYVVDW